MEAVPRRARHQMRAMQPHEPYHIRESCMYRPPPGPSQAGDRYRSLPTVRAYHCR